MKTEYLQTIEMLKVVFGAIISIVSIYVAILVYHLRKRQPWAQALFEIVNLLESEEVRNIRHKVIYKWPRENDDSWSAEGMNHRESQRAVDKWGAYMDMISLLYSTKQFNNVLFFEMYGDVIIRTAYKLAPYAVRQRDRRGEQFWLPFQSLVVGLLKMWKKRSRKGKYPIEIGIPGVEDRVTIDFFLRDTQFRNFIRGNSVTRPRWLK